MEKQAGVYCQEPTRPSLTSVLLVLNSQSPQG